MHDLMSLFFAVYCLLSWTELTELPSTATDSYCKNAQLTMDSAVTVVFCNP